MGLKKKFKRKKRKKEREREKKHFDCNRFLVLPLVETLKQNEIKGRKREKKKNARANFAPLAGQSENAPRGAPGVNKEAGSEDVNDTFFALQLFPAHACKCQVMLSVV